jgi:DNA-binding transcriptional ArsR family regulator
MKNQRVKKMRVRRRRIVQKDEETGEILEGVVAYFPLRRQNGFRRWFAMGQEEALDVLMDFKHVDDFRVLMALAKEVDYENQILVSQVEIARRLKMQPSNVSSAIKRLVEAGIVLRGLKKGIKCLYQLSPELGWKGSAKNHITAKREYQESKRKTAVIANAPEQKV